MHFGPTGDLVPFDLGNQFGNIFSSGGDGVKLADLANLTTPSERFLINGLGHYKITENVEIYMETFFANTTANDQISQAVWQTDFFDGSSSAVQQNTNNPLLTAQAAGFIRDECASSDAADVAAFDAAVLAHPQALQDALDAGEDAPDDPVAPIARTAGGDCNFLIARSSRDLALGNNVSELNMFRVVGGIRGDFEVSDRSFNWDVSYNLGRSNSTSVSDGVDDRRMSFALDPVAFSQGQIDTLDTTSRFKRGSWW